MIRTSPVRSYIGTDHPPAWEKAHRSGNLWRFVARTTYTAKDPDAIQYFSPPKPSAALIATVTRDANVDSPTFNRWYVVMSLQEKKHFATLADAKAWVQALWRLQ